MLKLFRMFPMAIRPHVRCPIRPNQDCGVALAFLCVILWRLRRPSLIDRSPHMPEVHSLHDVFVHELRDMYNAEQQITKALPKLIKAAESEDLREAFETHLDE